MQCAEGGAPYVAYGVHSVQTPYDARTDTRTKHRTTHGPTHGPNTVKTPYDTVRHRTTPYEDRTTHGPKANWRKYPGQHPAWQGTSPHKPFRVSGVGRSQFSSFRVFAIKHKHKPDTTRMHNMALLTRDRLEDVV